MRILVVLLAVSGGVFTQTLPDPRLYRVATGLDQPTDIQSARDGTGRLFIVEQPGRIRIIKNGTLLPTPFLDIRNKVSCCGERGLLGLAFPPQFPARNYFYVNYTDVRGDTVISRIRLSSNPDIADSATEQPLLQIDQPFSNHNGGGIAFNPKDGFLYIGMGDGGSGGDPQNHGQRGDSLLGKMLRIDTESGASPYAVPPSNPFVGRPGYRPEIWATGVRNPWRFAFDRETGDLWMGDVGQNRAEEVNFQPGSSQGGENYGWRRMEGLQCYPPDSACDRNGLTLPVLEYAQSTANGCSVTGGKVYRGARWTDLQGVFLYADYCSGNLWGVRRNASGEFENRLLLPSALDGFTTFGEDENGEIYAGSQGGTISLITAGSPTTAASNVVNAASFSSGISPGSLATVFGTGITSFSGTVAAERFPLPTEIAGTSVTLNGTSVPLLAVASVGNQEQINFQVPYELAGVSRATLVIRANGQSSAPVEVAITMAQPEIFVITPQRPVSRGDTITIWATGLGAVTNAPGSGRFALTDPLSRVIAAVEVRIGGIVAPVGFAGLAPGFAGLYQINAQVAAGTPTGPQELTIITSGATSKAVTLVVQ